MAIRDKLKAKFSRSKTSGSEESTSPVDGHYTGRTDIEYYKPHEIPKSKYGRGRVDPDHQERLDAYSFGDAFAAVKRRASTALSGTFSPGGTKALSAAPSAAVSRRTSYVAASRSRASSVGGSSNGGSPTYDNGSISSGKISEASNESGEDDLSRVGTVKELNDSSGTLDRQSTVTARKPDHKKTTSHDTPFSVEELERAMTKATMRDSTENMSRHAIAVS